MTLSLDLQLRASARAHHLLFWLHSLPLVLLPLAMASGPWMLALAFGIGASWLWLRRHPAFGYGPKALTRLRAEPEGGWLLVRRNGQRIEAQLSPDSYVQANLMILRFRDLAGARYTRIILGDESTDEGLRRLRVRLAAGPDKTEPAT
ncbi:MAG: protein YgfX [Panacagrimonas sp.]